MELFEIRSSHGVLYADKIKGLVKKIELYDNISIDALHLQVIISFDIEEWKKYHNKLNLPRSIDILDLGYTYTDGVTTKYAPAVAEWRKLVKTLRRRT